jgi:hypothetical protein
LRVADPKESADPDFESANEAFKLILGPASVALIALANEPELRKSDANHHDRLHGQDHSMSSCRVGENRFDRSEVDAQRNGAARSRARSFPK